MLQCALLIAGVAALAHDGGVKVDDLGWMAGTWTCSVWGGTFQETWLPPSGGTLQGTGRLVRDGKVVFMEFMTIEAAENGKAKMFVLNQRLSEGSKTPEPFALVSQTSEMVKFERGGDDFPQIITYSKTKSGMFCRIEGMQKGQPAHTDFNFTKLKTR